MPKYSQQNVILCATITMRYHNILSEFAGKYTQYRLKTKINLIPGFSTVNEVKKLKVYVPYIDLAGKLRAPQREHLKLAESKALIEHVYRVVFR